MKFLYSHTDPERGFSKVLVEHRHKLFSGIARLHPEDTFSEFTGCRYAEIRAHIEALKDEWRDRKNSTEECRKFIKACEQYKTFNKTEETAKVMYRQLNKRIKEVNRLADEITALELRLKAGIRLQDRITQMADKRKSLMKTEEK